MHGKLNSRGRGESGQATAWFVGIAILLFGIIAFAYDIGLLFTSRRMAQNAVDAGVLAGAAHMEGCDLYGLGDPVLVGEDYTERNLRGKIGASDDDPDVKILEDSFELTDDFLRHGLLEPLGGATLSASKNGRYPQSPP